MWKKLALPLCSFVFSLLSLFFFLANIGHHVLKAKVAASGIPGKELLGWRYNLQTVYYGIFNLGEILQIFCALIALIVALIVLQKNQKLHFKKMLIGFAIISLLLCAWEIILNFT